MPRRARRLEARSHSPRLRKTPLVPPSLSPLWWHQASPYSADGPCTSSLGCAAKTGASCRGGARERVARLARVCSHVCAARPEARPGATLPPCVVPPRCVRGLRCVLRRARVARARARAPAAARRTGGRRERRAPLPGAALGRGSRRRGGHRVTPRRRGAQECPWVASSSRPASESTSERAKCARARALQKQKGNSHQPTTPRVRGECWRHAKARGAARREHTE